MKRIIQRTAALIAGLMLGVGAWAGLETVTHISDLNTSWPLGSDLASTSDDHIRNIKVALKTDFPNVNGAVTPTPAQFNQLTTNTFTGAVTGNSFAATSSTLPTNGIYLPSANTLGIATNSTQRATINASGDWTIIAPTAGEAFKINGLNSAGTPIFEITDGTLRLGSYLTTSAQFGTVSNHSLGFFTNNGGAALTIATSGAVSVSAPTAAIAVTATGAANKRTLLLTGSSTSGQSYGLEVDAGTTSADEAVAIYNQAGSNEYFQVRGDGVIQARGTVAAALVDMTPDTTSTTGTLTGCTTSPTTTVRLSRSGNLVTVSIDGVVTCTSNATTFTLTGAIPSSFQPARQQAMAFPGLSDNTTNIAANASVTTGSQTITFSRLTGGFTASGVKGFIYDGGGFSYQLR